MSVRRSVIIVFAKEPRPGQVKTRLCPPLGPDQAAEFYSLLLDDVLEETARFSVEHDLEALLAVHPSSALRSMAKRAPVSFRVVPQRGANLSQRMEAAAAAAAAAGAERILLRGSDSPLLGSQIVGEALRALEVDDLVICPDEGGGYSLIGMRRFVPGLFDHPMSTLTVLEDTLSNAASLDLKTRKLTGSIDLDTAKDLRQLARLRGSADSKMCQRALRWLDENRVWDRLDPRDIA